MTPVRVVLIPVADLRAGPWARPITSDRLARARLARAGWEPIQVTKAGVVVDGWARVEASRLDGIPAVSAVMFQGTEAEAWEAAAAANIRGTNWTRAQRRLAVMTLLDENPARSSRDIARALVVSASLVERVRREGDAAAGSPRWSASRIGADGRSRAVDHTPLRRAIQAMVDLDPDRSDRSIAASLKCSPTTVGDLRRRALNRRWPRLRRRVRLLAARLRGWGRARRR